MVLGDNQETGNAFSQLTVRKMDQKQQDKSKQNKLLDQFQEPNTGKNTLTDTKQEEVLLLL